LLQYKAAKEKGIKVISLEGRNLRYGKDSELRNENREQYITDVINEIRSKGYNVIANVGSSHVVNLEKALKNNQVENTDFSQISRKIRQEALKIPEAIPVRIASMEEVNKDNNTSWQDLVTS
jgi:basic membrane lipoprotein Med (substrate-binding protein (PBP1-ABC) superfamily)